MQLTADDRRLITDFNRNIAWLKSQSLKEQKQVWGSYEEVAKILNRSKAWYKRRRLDHINEFNILVPAQLVKDKDWRMEGNRVVYNLASIAALKEKISVS